MSAGLDEALEWFARAEQAREVAGQLQQVAAAVSLRCSTAERPYLLLPAIGRRRPGRSMAPSCVRLELLARVTLNPGKHPGDEPARLAHLAVFKLLRR